MVTEFTPRSFADHLHKLASAIPPDAAIARELVPWLRENEGFVGFSFAGAAAVQTKSGRKRAPKSGTKLLSKKAWDGLVSELCALADSQMPEPITQNAATLGATLGLSAVETRIFALVALAGNEPAIYRLFEAILLTRRCGREELLALCLGVDACEVQRVLDDGSLFDLGLVDGDLTRSREFELYIPYTVRMALRPRRKSAREIEQSLLGTPVRSNLNWSDFDFIARERDFMANLLRGGLRAGHKGVNVLLYGPPGAGKTELSKVLASRLRCDLFTVGEADEEGDEPSRFERLDALRLAERLGARRGRTVLLFDEMEDILSDGDVHYTHGRRTRRAGSKVFFNRLLEKNRVPIIWTANDLGEFDPAFLRRMSFVLEMKAPPQKVRARQWRRLARRADVPLSLKQAGTLARRHAITPALQQTALNAVAMAGAGSGDLETVLGNLGRAVGCVPLKEETSAQCDRELLNPDRDLAPVEAMLSKPDGPRDVSFLFYGPPGTGKSAYARKLAEAAGLAPLVKKGSQLLSMWVGETEKLIAAAFEEAREDQRFLIVDEAETFFWAREGASKSWEVSMVNEFLTALEAHPLPVACTTNHMERMDLAALRRFAFKVKFDFLAPNQLDKAFDLFFGLKAPAALRKLNLLTPGDFAAVRRQIRFDETAARSPERLCALLEAEMSVKTQGKRRIGF